MDFHASGAEKLLYPFRIIYSGEARRKMRQVIDRFHPDIIHFNNINFQLTPSVILAGAEKISRWCRPSTICRCSARTT